MEYCGNDFGEWQKGVTQAFGKMYFAIYSLDLTCGCYLEISTLDIFREHIPPQGASELLLDMVIKHYVSEGYREEMRKFLDVETLSQRLSEQNSVSCDFFGTTQGWCRASLIAEKRDEQGQVTQVVYVTQEINEEIKTEQERIAELKKAYAAVEAANQAKTDFLFCMSHDLRTPLNAIMGFNQLIAAYAEDPAKVSEFSEKIQMSGKLLLSLLNGILDMTKIESGSEVMDMEEFALDELLTGLELVTASQAAQKAQSFVMQKEKVEHTCFIGDQRRIARVLLNILGNAVEYTKPGGTVVFSVYEEAADTEGMVHLFFRIQDTGIGMTPEFKEVVFEKFLRGSEDTVMQTPGIGLGLAVAKRFTENMGGEIRVASEAGKGSEFVVRIPIRALESDETQDRSAQGSWTGKDAEKRGQAARTGQAAVKQGQSAAKKDEYLDVLNGLSILIVEDNELNMEVVAGILGMAGAQCDMAYSGAQALQKIEQAPEGTYDLVIMDVRMPGMDGYETTRRIRKMERAEAANLPIVALTANAYAEDVEHAYQAGMNAHMSKPLDVGQLRRTIGELFATEPPRYTAPAAETDQ